MLKDFFTKLFDQSFAARWEGTCAGWTKELAMAHVIADSIIWIAYMTIPLFLIFIAKKRKDLPFNYFFLLFAIFIVGCGLTHLVGAIVAFYPFYYIDFWVKAITALASIGTAWLLWKSLDQIVNLPNPFETVKKLETSNAELEDYHKIFELSLDMMCISNETHFVKVNKAFTTILGYSEEYLLKTPYLEMIHPEDIERTKEESKKLLEIGKVVGFKNRFLDKDGNYHWINWKAITTNGVIYGTGRDETERMLMIEALEKSNKELEQFVYIASHDLQEPLRMVASYCNLIEKRYKDKLDASGVEFIHYAVDGAKRMQNLISDLLKYSRVGKYKTLVNVNLNKCLSDAISNLSAVILNTIIYKEHLPQVYGDEIQLTQLFQNLISNSIKFKRDEVDSIIGISCTIKENYCTICVEDNGIGIDMNIADRLFVIFQRLNADKVKYPGTGIGLAICRKIVEKHGGKIWIESEKGSKFYFTLKLFE